MTNYARAEIIEAIEGKLRRNFGCELEEAGAEKVFKACALVMRDIMSNKLVDTEARLEESENKQVHYLSLEFLLGRSLEKNAFNVGMLELITGAIKELGFDPDEFFEVEPDAALGNGGLGRLAACYLEAMTTQGIPATGYSILYEYGIFKQKIIDGEQQELPDKWLDIDDVWLLRDFDSSYIVRFGGSVEYDWQEGRMVPRYIGSSDVRATPADMLISGYSNDTVNRLRLWTASAATDMDMSLFSQGQYLKALEDKAMAEVITKLLYPEDNHYEGKMLRLRQQYFFVSATVQDIVAKHRAKYGTLKNFHEKHILQINDTHPTFVIPELMRILMDEEGYGWEEAWEIVKKSVAYTNHTVLSEALECWPQPLVQSLVPRIYDITLEIDRRFNEEIDRFYGGYDDSKRRILSVLYGGQVRMANLCVAACCSINGVSALHTEILKKNVFKDAYEMFPEKFVNVTNGIDHRRWLAQANPGLTSLVTELIGDGFYINAGELKGLEKYADDRTVQKRLDEIKLENKKRMAKYIKEANGIVVDPASLFDVQVKRLHEYKRQLLNVMHIVHLYNRIKSDPSIDMQPHTFIFGAKAAPGYYVAKEIIHLINSVADHINSDPEVKDRIKVVFLENYRVSLAEMLMPASELSEQISLAGMEASGTGNMKFMINGGLTIGTMDGANVEICDRVGRENMFIFGMTAGEVEELGRHGYNPVALYDNDLEIKAVIDRIRAGFKDGVNYTGLMQSLLFDDRYRLLADFESYRAAQERAVATYADREKWNRMSVINIANAGYFAADRSVKEYAEKIWHVTSINGSAR